MYEYQICMYFFFLSKLSKTKVNKITLIDVVVGASLPKRGAYRSHGQCKRMRFSHEWKLVVSGLLSQCSCVWN